MDERTRELYNELKANKIRDCHTFAEHLLDEVVKNGAQFKFLFRKDYRKLYHSYNGESAEWYRCLAFTLYGYGNWSNNDRRMKGLGALRNRYRKLW